MQNKTRAYAAALVNVLEKAPWRVRAQRLRNFKKLLKKRGDLKLVSKILQEFSKLWKERKGTVAYVISAKPLRPHARESLKRALVKKGFLYEEKIDPSLIGGVQILLGQEYFIDNSIKAKLRKLRSQLA